MKTKVNLKACGNPVYQAFILCPQGMAAGSIIHDNKLFKYLNLDENGVRNYVEIDYDCAFTQAELDAGLESGAIV